MLLIVGSVVVVVCILAGYLMEGGALGALFQPAELVIIGGAALGALIISTPIAAQARLRRVRDVLQGRPASGLLELLGMMPDLPPDAAVG
jgi:flagellar motor component MotA